LITYFPFRFKVPARSSRLRCRPAQQLTNANGHHRKTLINQGKATRAPRSGRGGRRFKSCHSDQTSRRHFNVLSRRNRRPQALGQLSGQKRRSRLSTLTSAPLLIVIEPTASGRKWIARVGDREVCKSTSPFVKSARLLLDEGYSADAAIEMWRPNTDDWALQGLALRQERLSGSRSRAGWPRGGLPLVCARARVVCGADDDTLERSNTSRRRVAAATATRSD
jgi:hypothetical protein